MVFPIGLIAPIRLIRPILGSIMQVVTNYRGPVAFLEVLLRFLAGPTGFYMVSGPSERLSGHFCTVSYCNSRRKNLPAQAVRG